jgi:nucleoside-diphosphate-sugar epimerase
MKKKCTIVGLGWLGEPLAKHLMSNRYAVSGTTTNEKKAQRLRAKQIKTSVFSLGDDLENPELISTCLQADTLVLTIPPSRSDESFTESYPHHLIQLIDAFLEHSQAVEPRIIYTSSTSVFGDCTGKVFDDDEASPESQSAKAIVQVEEYLQSLTVETISVRLGGLYGPDRHPVVHLAGRDNISDGNDPVNLVHLDDVMAVISFLTNRTSWPKHINVVAPEHPVKEEYYQEAARMIGLSTPTFEFTGGDGKQIMPEWLLKKAKYKFKHPTPLSGIDTSVGADDFSL